MYAPLSANCALTEEYMSSQETVSHKVSDSLYVVRQRVSSVAPAKPVEVPTNHIAVIDCSGSMSGELPRIREQLKKKLPKLLSEQDTISIIWFSGRGEFGVLLEAEPVSSLKDLKDVEKAIDRWLRPVGLTGFKEPIEEAARLVTKIGATRKGSLFSLFFMSDGWDNQSSRPDIIKAVEKAAGGLAAATFVEYGNYADRALLAQMAEKAGGSLVLAEHFDKFAPALEASLQKRPSGAPRIEAAVKGDAIGGFAFTLSGGDLITFDASSGKVQVPQDTGDFYYLAPASVGTAGPDISSLSKSSSSDAIIAASYAAISLFSVRMKPELILPLLRALGDVRYVDQFSGCFGKQKYSEFQDGAKTAAFDSKARWSSGWDPNRVPKDDAFTVLDLLRILSEDDGNSLLLSHPEFKYNKIGRARDDASTKLTDAEVEELEQLTKNVSAERNVKKLQELQARIAELTANRPEPLKFVESQDKDAGYPISALIYNEERPNVSVQTRKAGIVDLGDRIPAEFAGSTLGKIPSTFSTFVYRNYTIIRDGIINIDRLPVRITADTGRKLHAAGLPREAEFSREGQLGENSPATVVYDLRKLPVINRVMVREASAKVLFEKEFELTVARAAQKVYNAFKKEHFPRTSEGFEALYGKEATTWLREQGFTDYSGFSPKSVQAAAQDEYMAKELKVALKGLSTLPTLDKLREAIAKGKMNAPAEIMAPFLKEVETFLASPAYTKSTKQSQLLEGWLDGQTRSATSTVRGLLFEMAQIKFSVIVGQVWFKEFKSLDENTMTVDVGGRKVDGTVTMREIPVKI